MLGVQLTALMKQTKKHYQNFKGSALQVTQAL